MFPVGNICFRCLFLQQFRTIAGLMNIFDLLIQLTHFLTGQFGIPIAGVGVAIS